MKAVQLDRVTTRYVASEDRLRVAGAAEGGTVVVWLTQRLVRNLVPALVRLLEQRPAEKPGEAAKTSPPEERRRELQQGFAQSAARAALERQAPVKSANPDAQWLASAVDLTPGPRAIRLVFKGAENAQSAACMMSVRQLRQWLSILHDQCQKAGWSIDVWPDWVRGTPPRESGAPGTLH